jgi:hypothetical protein
LSDRPFSAAMKTLVSSNPRDGPVTGWAQAGRCARLRGRLCGLVLLIWGVGEGGMPAVDVAGELVARERGYGPEGAGGTARGPAHLLLCDHASRSATS